MLKTKCSVGRRRDAFTEWHLNEPMETATKDGFEVFLCFFMTALMSAASCRGRKSERAAAEPDGRGVKYKRRDKEAKRRKDG